MMIRRFAPLLLALLLVSPCALAQKNFLDAGKLRPFHSLEIVTASVKAAKERMLELDYYPKSESDVDDEADETFVRRLRLFQFYHCLPITGELDEDTLAMLYSDEARSEEDAIAASRKDPACEPAYTCVITPDARGEWEGLGNLMDMRFEVANISSKRTIDAFELTLIPYDAWGDPITDEDGPYIITTVKSIKPGKKAFSNRVCVIGRKEAERVSVGVSKVRYSDGEVVNIDEDEIVYAVWKGPFTGK